MYPRLFEFGWFTVYSYGLLLALAYLLGLQMALVRARRRGMDSTRIMDLGIWIIISALIGAKLMLLVVDWDYFSRNPRELLSLAQSGGVFYGGLLAAIVVCIYQLRKHQLPLWHSADLFAPGIALGYMVGRLGCLAAGCCFGKPTDVAWAVTFTDPAANLNVGTPLNIPLHPTQIYEASAGLLIFLILIALERRGRAFAGRTFWLFVLLYSISRFVIEFYRGDDRGMVFNMLSTSQFISVVLAPLSLVMLWYLSRPVQPATPEAPSRPRKPRFA